MTAPVPEENDEALDLTEPPPGEHASELPGQVDAAPDERAEQQENAGSSLDQPSDD